MTAARLARTQRWFQAVVTHPDGVPAGVASAAAQAEFAVADAAAVLTRSRNLTAAERLEVYHHAYFARLLSCLREEFPILVQTITEEVFDAFASDYLQRHPSRSYTLGRLSAAFTAYLAGTRADEGDAPAEPGWEEFVIDLATLEWTYGEVFDGPGVETEPPFDPAALAALDPEAWPAVRFSPVPCLRLLALRFPVNRFYAAARTDADTPPPAAAATYLAVTRRDYVVRHVELSAAEFALLTELTAGAAMGPAVAGLAARGALDPADLEEHLTGWFYKWAAEGFFRGLG